MTAGTVVITGGILATVILLCIIAVLCYCRLQVSARGPGPQAASKPLPQRGGNKAPSLESGRLVSRELDLAGWSEGSFPSACTLGTRASELGKHRVLVWCLLEV